MGEVFKARDIRLDRTVAIKILPAVLASDPQFRERFEREARTISQLDSPNICALYDVGVEQGTSYLVMQYREERRSCSSRPRDSRSRPTGRETASTSRFTSADSRRTRAGTGMPGSCRPRATASQYPSSTVGSTRPTPWFRQTAASSRTYRTSRAAARSNLCCRFPQPAASGTWRTPEASIRSGGRTARS